MTTSWNYCLMNSNDSHYTRPTIQSMLKCSQFQWNLGAFWRFVSMVTHAAPTTSRQRWHFRSNRQCELCVNWNSHAIQNIFDIAWPLFSNEVLKTSHSSPEKARYWCLFWVKNVNTVPDFSLPIVVQYRVLVHRVHYDVTVMFNRKVLLSCQLCTKWRLSMDTLSVLPGSAFIKPDQLDPGIKDQIKITLLPTISHLQLLNFVSCERACPSHMTQKLVTVGAKLWTAECFLFDPWSLDQADLVW